MFRCLNIIFSIGVFHEGAGGEVVLKNIKDGHWGSFLKSDYASHYRMTISALK